MSADTFSAFEEVELGNRSALREVGRRYVSFLRLLADTKGRLSVSVVIVLYTNLVLRL